ncbi:MAG: MaoC family dehydratase [Bacteroidales bacterium]
MEIKIGDRYEKIFIIDEEMINKFSSSTGDANQIHLDDNYAKNRGFKKRIVQGFLVGSLISTVLGNYFPGNGTIYMSQLIRFRQPVYIYDQVKVIIEAVEITKNNWLKLKTTCKNQFGNLIIDGEAIVIPPDNCTIIL